VSIRLKPEILALERKLDHNKEILGKGKVGKSVLNAGDYSRVTAKIRYPL
jgi:hypothetical protein